MPFTREDALRRSIGTGSTKGRRRMRLQIDEDEPGRVAWRRALRFVVTPAGGPRRGVKRDFAAEIKGARSIQRHE